MNPTEAKPIPDAARAGLVGVAWLGVVGYFLAGFGPGVIDAIGKFPLGLLYLLGFSGGGWFLVIALWIFYAALSVVTVKARQRGRFFSLFTGLCLLLILNAFAFQVLLRR